MKFLKIISGHKTYFVQRRHLVYVESEEHSSTIHLSNGISLSFSRPIEDVVIELCKNLPTENNK